MCSLKIVVIVVTITLVTCSCLMAQDTINGVVWHPPAQLSDGASDAFGPSIALSGDDSIHFTWHSGFPLRLPYRRSTDGGQTFESTRAMITDSSFTLYYANNPKVVASGQNVFLFFMNNDPPSGHTKVRMFRSLDGGTTFEPMKEVSLHEAGFIDQVTIFGDTIAIIYPGSPYGRELLYSTDAGSNWHQTGEVLSPADDPQIAITPGFFHLTKNIDTGVTLESRYQRSSDLGSTWSVDTILSEVNWYYSDFPSIGADQTDCGTEVHVLWRDTKYGAIGWFGASVIRRMSIDGGIHWTTEDVLTENPDGAFPVVSIHGNVRAITWWKDSPLQDSAHVTVRASNKDWYTLLPELDVTPHAYTGSPPTVIASATSIHVAWEEKVDSTFRIFYRRGEFLHRNASFSLSASELSFDTTIVDYPATDTITVRNTGMDTLIIGSTLTLDTTNFGVSPPIAAIPPGGNAPFTVTFHPRSQGSLATNLVFYHNGQSSPDCITLSGEGLWREVAVPYSPDAWNMLSTPVLSGRPTTLPLLYSFENGSYKKVDSMFAGTGYWAKPSDSLYTFSGSGITQIDIPVRRGWNLVGGMTKGCPVSSITTLPDSLFNSGFYMYQNDAYTLSDTLQPGRSYWVKVKTDGTVLLR